MPKKSTQAERLENLEIMIASLIEGKPDPPKQPAPTLPQTLLYIVGISGTFLICLALLKYITTPPAQPIYNVKTEVHQTTDNHCWILCRPGGQNND